MEDKAILTIYDTPDGGYYLKYHDNIEVVLEPLLAFIEAHVREMRFRGHYKLMQSEEQVT